MGFNLTKMSDLLDAQQKTDSSRQTKMFSACMADYLIILQQNITMQ